MGIPTPRDLARQAAPSILGHDFDPAKLRKRTVTVDIETDYVDTLNVGDTLHTVSGFSIGTITDVVR